MQTIEKEPKHESPNRRLIQQKNATVKHKKKFKGSVDRAKYSLMYNPTPEKSYIIEPHGGEIQYDLAYDMRSRD